MNVQYTQRSQPMNVQYTQLTSMIKSATATQASAEQPWEILCTTTVSSNNNSLGKCCEPAISICQPTIGSTAVSKRRYGSQQQLVRMAASSSWYVWQPAAVGTYGSQHQQLVQHQFL